MNADEIEQEFLKDHDEIEALTLACKEIERLRQSVAMAWASSKACQDENEQLREELLTRNSKARSQAEEIERLRDVIDRAARAWLSLDPPMQWEGDVGDAIVAAVAEIERLRGLSDITRLDVMWQELVKERYAAENNAAVLAAEVQNLRSEIERLRGLLREMSEACYAFNDGNRDPWVRFNASLSRLREALGETVSYQWSTATHPYPRERTWSDCEAEIERLRKALLQIAALAEGAGGVR